MDEKKLQLSINSFLEKKQITHPFVRECVSDFVLGHTKLFGSVVPADELLSRLDKNLDKITFTGTPNGTKIGEYKGRVAENVDQNEILMYKDLKSIELSPDEKEFFPIYSKTVQAQVLQKLENEKKEIRGSMLHELTHASYSIKSLDGKRETQMFATYGKNLLGANHFSFVSGNNNFVEAITNFISTRIECISQDEISTYVPQTKVIYALAEKMGEEAIIKSSWDSSESSFIESFTKSFGNNYEAFNKKIAKLNNDEERSDFATDIGRFHVKESRATFESLKNFIYNGQPLEAPKIKVLTKDNIKPLQPLQQEDTTASDSKVSNQPKIKNSFVAKAVKKIFGKNKNPEANSESECSSFGEDFRPVLKPPEPKPYIAETDNLKIIQNKEPEPASTLEPVPTLEETHIEHVKIESIITTPNLTDDNPANEIIQK